MISFNMVRNKATVATVYLDISGRAVVFWPTSVIIYESFEDLWRVHVEHMKGRGEETLLSATSMPEEVDRGWQDCYQDRCEGIGLRLVDSFGMIQRPEYISEEDFPRYERGYAACSVFLFGPEWAQYGAKRSVGKEGTDA